MKSLLVLLPLLISKTVAEEWNPETHPRWSLLDDKNCGESNSDRIIGGKLAVMGKYPWMARLGYLNSGQSSPAEYMCGGSLINTLYVLTAAHCVDKISMSPFRLKTIRVGQHNLYNVNCLKNVCPKVQEFAPAKVIRHENFNQDNMQNDIALVRLNKPAKLTTFVVPICMPHGALMSVKNYPRVMEVAGWGIYDIRKRQMNKNLTYIHIPIKEISICRIRMGSKLVTGKGQICAGGEEGFDSCGGDSGGPLMAPYALDGPPKIYQFGLVSFGMVMCGSDSPAIYTDIRYFLRWILNNIAA